MKKRKARCKLKCVLKKYTPKSSRLYSFATDFKLWYVTYLHRCNCFFTKFAAFKRLTTKKLLQKRKQTSCCCSDKVRHSTSLTKFKRYSLSRINFDRSFNTVESFDVRVSIVGVAPSFREFHKHFLQKHSKLVKVKRGRDREPFGVPVKKIINSMKREKPDASLSSFLRNTPLNLHDYTALPLHYFKLWYVTYLHRCNCFFY